MSYKLFKYFNISKTKKIRYLHNSYKNNLYVVFLHGFMSDLEGEKPKVFQKYAKKNMENMGTRIMQAPKQYVLLERPN